MAQHNREEKRPRAKARFALGLIVTSGFFFIGTAAVRSEPLPLSLADQTRVYQAIRRGVNYLKSTQGPLGTWAPAEGAGASHPYGYAALPALTLLECNVPASNSLVQRALSYLDRDLDKITGTYELALTILFLDQYSAMNDRLLARVGEQELIRRRIERLAVRLIAGQKVSGGWHYSCPTLTEEKHRQLYRALTTEPAKLQKAKLAKWLLDLPVLYNPDQLMGRESKTVSEGKAKEQESKAARKETPLVDLFADKADKSLYTSDNSNTQFATLAVWVSQRHQVPVDKSIKLIVKRFRSSQNADGSWGYEYKRGGGVPRSPAMICSGLVGLTVDRGLDDPVAAAWTSAAKDGTAQLAATAGAPSVLAQYLTVRAVKKLTDAERRKRKQTEEEHLRKGFEALAQDVGQPAGRFTDVPQGNLYFLWALERVAIVYDLQTIGGKDWYRWGAEMLVANQKPDGQWEKGSLADNPVIDTCFALLFLRQANLAEDLAEKLKMDALAADKPPVKQEPAPAAVPSVAQRPSSPEKSAKRSESPAGLDKEEVPLPKIPSSAPVKLVVETPAGNNSSSSDSGGNMWLIWGGVGAGVLLAVGGIVAFVVVSLAKAGGSAAARPERLKRRAPPEEDEDDEEPRRESRKTKARKRGNPARD